MIIIAMDIIAICVKVENVISTMEYNFIRFFFEFLGKFLRKFF